MTHGDDRLDRILAFLRRAERLKDTTRSARTGRGAPETVAAHSWGLSLLVILLERDLEGLDLARLLKLSILHDLGEAISGDIPAIHQDPTMDKSVAERADFHDLTAELPGDLCQTLRALWDEYDQAASPEAVVIKGLDKIETMLQHVTGDQVAGFDFAWNLGYGTDRTDKTALLRALRVRVDALTRQAIADQRR